MPVDVFNEAISYMERRESNCILLILGDRDKIIPPHSQVPVMQWTRDKLPQDECFQANCGSMIATHDGLRDNWIKLLPWIHNPVLITNSLDSFADSDFRHLKRLEPIFFVTGEEEKKKDSPARFTVYTWKYHKNPSKFAIYDGSHGYRQRDHVYTSTLTLNSGYQLDFGGHDFPSVAFQFPPYSLPDYEEQENNGGFEYEIALAVAKGLNLRLVVSPPSTGKRWGSADAYGNYTGKKKVQGNNRCFGNVDFSACHFLQVLWETFSMGSRKLGGQISTSYRNARRSSTLATGTPWKNFAFCSRSLDRGPESTPSCFPWRNLLGSACLSPWQESHATTSCTAWFGVAKAFLSAGSFFIRPLWCSRSLIDIRINITQKDLGTSLYQFIPV